jgi:hypothetical protein
MSSLALYMPYKSMMFGLMRWMIVLSLLGELYSSIDYRNQKCSPRDKTLDGLQILYKYHNILNYLIYLEHSPLVFFLVK